MAAVTTSLPPASTSPSALHRKDAARQPVSSSSPPHIPVDHVTGTQDSLSASLGLNFSEDDLAQQQQQQQPDADVASTQLPAATRPLGHSMDPSRRIGANDSLPQEEPPFLPPSRQPLSQSDRSSPVALNRGKARATPDVIVSPTTSNPPTMSGRVDSGLLATHNQSHLRKQEADRDSRESDDTTGTSQQPASVKSSATTSASSLSGSNDRCPPDADSPGSSIIEGNFSLAASVPQFQYHHQPDHPQSGSGTPSDGAQTPNQDLSDSTGNVRRHLTPSHHARKNSLPRPQSAYSTASESQRGRSPGLMPGAPAIREHSVQSRRSPDVRPSSYAELLNVPYPQPGPAPINLDNSLLRNAVGNNASLLSAQKTLEMYRQNVKKTNDFSVQYSFAVFLISVAQEQGLDFSDPKCGGKSGSARNSDVGVDEAAVANGYDLVREARGILQKLASGGYPFAQYYLADGFASGMFNKGKEDYNSAFPLFVLAAKHGHAESGYRTALCYEFGWGCRKDPSKAVQFLRTAASKRHPGAMTRLGKACLSGDLGEKRYREGIKWMKLATEAADAQYNAAPYQLGCLYETGYGEDIFRDAGYAAELFTQSADLGHAEANYRMGDAYEHGYLNCPRDPALSVHFYTGAAERGHAGAMMGLCAWYMVGAPPILEKDEEESYEWARRSADLGNVKAQYAIGYFTEMGIGCRRDILEANVWYVKAADSGDERAKQRIMAIQAAVNGQGTPMDVGPPRNGKLTKESKEDSCSVM